jgi:hypothetical protein
MATTPRVTIGIIPRERFSLAAQAIRRIVEHTSVPYRLLVVDCNTPEPYRGEIERALPTDVPVEVLRFDRYLQPNESRNHVVAAAGTGNDGEAGNHGSRRYEHSTGNATPSDQAFLCLIDNDVLVEPGWLEPLLAACEQESAGVVRPAVFKLGKRHFDCRLGPVTTALGTPGHRLRIEDRTLASEFDAAPGRRRVEWLEMHCLLFRARVFPSIGPFDEALNTREHVDLSLTLRAKGVPIVFEPASRVHFVPPPPVHRDERAFFYFRWDPDKAVASNARVRTKWELASYRSNIDWVLARHARVGRLRTFVSELSERLAVVRRLCDGVERAVKGRRKQWGQSAARRRVGSLTGLEAGPLRIPIHEENTRYIRAGRVVFGVERRLPRRGDPGVSLHVFTEHEPGRRLERFRVDCLHDFPHYHYVFQDQGINQKFWIDPLAIEDTPAWALEMIRQHLPQIFATVEGPELANLADMTAIERVLPELASALREATDWTTDFEREYAAEPRVERNHRDAPGRRRNG